MKLYLVRHAESEANVNPEVYKTVLHPTIPLTENGIAQAIELGKKIEHQLYLDYKENKEMKSYAYVSPYTRARETYSYAQSIFQNFSKQPTMIVDATIHEHVCGSNLPQVRKLRYDERYDDLYFKESGSESYADVYARAKNFLVGLYAMHTNTDSIYIFSHQGFLKMLLGILMNKDPATFEYDFKNAEIVQFNL